MTRLFLIALLTTLARAWLAHCCGEICRMVFHHLAPNMPQLACYAAGLALGMTMIESAALLWRRR